MPWFSTCWTDTATAAADAAADTATGAADSAAEALTVENFSFDKVSEMISESSIGELQKTALVQSLKAAQDNPETLKAVLDTVREALGL